MKMNKILYAASFIILAIFPVQSALGGDENVSVFADIDSLEAFELIEKSRDDEDFIIIDVRTPGEFEISHIKGAVLIDYYSEEFSAAVDNLDRLGVYFVYCRSGNRSGKTMSMMKAMGFSTVYNLDKGIISWINAGYPVTDK